MGESPNKSKQISVILYLNLVKYAGHCLDKHLRGGTEGVSFSSKQLVAAKRAFVRTVICWVISGARMGVGDC